MVRRSGSQILILVLIVLNVCLREWLMILENPLCDTKPLYYKWFSDGLGPWIGWVLSSWPGLRLGPPGFRKLTCHFVYMGVTCGEAAPAVDRSCLCYFSLIMASKLASPLKLYKNDTSVAWLSLCSQNWALPPMSLFGFNTPLAPLNPGCLVHTCRIGYTGILFLFHHGLSSLSDLS